MKNHLKKTLFCRYIFNTNSTFTNITYHNMQHLSVTTERDVPIPKWLCHSLRVSSVYIVDCSILEHSAGDYVNIRGLHSMFITVLYANTTAQQFLPHFRAFPKLSPRKFPPFKALAVARLSSVLCLWFHQDIVIQLHLAQWFSPDHVYIILRRWFPCLSNWIVMSYIRFVIRSSQTPRLSSWRCRCCSQLAPSHYQKIMTRHMTLDDQLNSTLQFTYLIFVNHDHIWKNKFGIWMHLDVWLYFEGMTIFGKMPIFGNWTNFDVWPYWKVWPYLTTMTQFGNSSLYGIFLGNLGHSYVGILWYHIYMTVVPLNGISTPYYVFNSNIYTTHFTNILRMTHWFPDTF